MRATEKQVAHAKGADGTTPAAAPGGDGSGGDGGGDVGAGLDASEDLFTPGRLSVTLTVGQPLHVLVSTEDPSGRNPERLLADELTRREQVVLPAAVALGVVGMWVMAATCVLLRIGPF